MEGTYKMCLLAVLTAAVVLFLAAFWREMLLAFLMLVTIAAALYIIRRGIRR